MRRILFILFIVAFILLRLEACENRAGTKAGGRSVKTEAAKPRQELSHSMLNLNRIGLNFISKKFNLKIGVS